VNESIWPNNNIQVDFTALMLLAAISIMQPSKLFFYLDLCELLKSAVVIVNSHASSEADHISRPADSF